MGKKDNRTQIIYIAGYGRSGSTLLDIVLSNTENGFTLGEISNIFNERIEVSNEYYHDILYQTIEKLNLSEKEINEIRASDKLFSKFNGKHTLFWTTFLNTIQERQNVSIFIDSSKTTWFTLLRPKHLKQAGIDVKIIFLKASYKKMWKSALKGSNKSLQKDDTQKKKHYLFAIRTVMSKLLIDVLTKLIYINDSYQYVEIPFDEFISKPTKTINQISKNLEIDLPGLTPKIQENKFLIKGGYLGNRLRKKGTYISIKNKL